MTVRQNTSSVFDRVVLRARVFCETAYYKLWMGGKKERVLLALSILCPGISSRSPHVTRLAKLRMKSTLVARMTKSHDHGVLGMSMYSFICRSTH